MPVRALKLPGLGNSKNTESVNVKVQNVFHGRNNITYSTNSKYRTATTLCNQEIWFYLGMSFKYPVLR